MTKDEFAKGWKHFCNGINWDDTYLDAKAIRFMNSGMGDVLRTFQQRDDLLAACEKALKESHNPKVEIILDAAIALCK